MTSVGFFHSSTSIRVDWLAEHSGLVRVTQDHPRWVLRVGFGVEKSTQAHRYLGSLQRAMLFCSHSEESELVKD